MSFLCTLNAALQSVLQNVSVQISAADYSQFQKLDGCVQNLVFAIKFINSKSRDQEEGEEE